MHDVYVPDEPLVSLPVYFVIFANKQTASKSFGYRCVFLSKFALISSFSWHWPLFLVFFVWALVNGIHFSMSALLHFSLLPACRLTHAMIHGRITGAASAFEASLLER